MTTTLPGSTGRPRYRAPQPDPTPAQFRRRIREVHQMRAVQEAAAELERQRRRDAILNVLRQNGPMSKSAILDDACRRCDGVGRITMGDVLVTLIDQGAVERRRGYSSVTFTAVDADGGDAESERDRIRRLTVRELLGVDR